MGYNEFVEWMAFYDTEPFGESRADIQTAMLATIIANANRSKKSKRIKLDSFLVDWWKDGSKPDAILAKFRAAAEAASLTEKEPVNKADGTRDRNTRSRVSRRD